VMIGPTELGMMRQRYDGYGMIDKSCGNLQAGGVCKMLLLKILRTDVCEVKQVYVQQQDCEQRKLCLHECRGSRCCIADGSWTASPSSNQCQHIRLRRNTMASAEAGYATELADARSRLLKLKDRAAARARALGNAVTPSQRDALGDSLGASAGADRTTDANGLEDSGHVSELQKLVAAFLLDPANGVPLDSHKIHREVTLIFTLVSLGCAVQARMCT
jgi:hypothetical protein